MPPPCAPSFGPWWLVRWLLVLLLVWDQVASPLHQHHHDSGVDGLWSFIQHAGGAAEDQHLEDADDLPRLSHAVLAMRPKTDPGAQPAGEARTALIAQTLSDLRLPEEPRPGRAVLRPDGRPPPFTSPLCLPPAGRAPPLHA